MSGLKRTGLVAILLGLGLLCWAAGVGLNVRTLDPSLPGVSVGQALFMGGILAGQVIAGVLLLVGGLGIRAGKDWARKMLLFLAWLGMAGFGAGIVALNIFYVSQEDVGIRNAGFMAAATLLLGAFVLLLWYARTYLSSELVKDACGHDGEGGTLKYWIAGLAALVLLGPAALVQGLNWHSAWRISQKMEHLREQGAVLDPMKWKPEMPPENENAAPVLKKAFAEFSGCEKCLKNADPEKPDLPGDRRYDEWQDLITLPRWTDEHGAVAPTVLECYKDALPRLREASRYPHCVFDWNYAKGAWMPIEEASDLRLSVELLCLSARCNLHSGEPQKAAQDILHSLALARFPDRDHSPMLHAITEDSVAKIISCLQLLFRRKPFPHSAIH